MYYTCYSTYHTLLSYYSCTSHHSHATPTYLVSILIASRIAIEFHSARDTEMVKFTLGVRSILFLVSGLSCFVPRYAL